MMFSLIHNINRYDSLIIWQCVCLFGTSHLVRSQSTFTATIKLSNPGSQFAPVVMSAQLISSTLTDTVKKCSILCTNDILCRIFDYGVSLPNQCRLFEGDLTTLGQIVPSTSPQSSVGIVQLTPNLFTEYGSSCSSTCSQSRYLQCGSNFTCQCMPHTYWDSYTSMCIPQSPILGAACQQNKSMCREDLNYTCLQFNQCGPLSILEGKTIMNNVTLIGGGATPGLNNPSGIVLFGANSDSLVVTDAGNDRVLALWNINSTPQNISIVATEWAPGRSLNAPRDVYIDMRNSTNLYMSEAGRDLVLLYSNMQSVNPLPRIVAGTNDSSATGLQRLNNPNGIRVDKNYNVIVASTNNHQIIYWPRNATSGIVIAGLGVVSNASAGLDNPNGIELDEDNGWLYVADSGNHRIQRYSLNDTWPCVGTTVAGGNGPGSGSHQLWNPVDIRLSKKTGAIYIVEKNNHRIQRWQPGATQGVTVVGSATGTAGSGATRLRNPAVLALNRNETYMYVIDRTNNRIQQFQLI